MKINPEDTAAKSDQMNSVDLTAPITGRIVKVDYNPKQEQPVKLFLEGYEKRPYKPCKSMLRGLVKAWGDETDNWSDKLIRIHCDPTVTWAGEATGGIRITAISGIDKPFEFTIQLNRKQRKVETWDVLSGVENTAKVFVLTHAQSEIEEAKTIKEVEDIARNVRDEFGVDAMMQVKDDVVKARERIDGEKI